MKKPRQKKSKERRIQDALRALNTALNMEEPDITIQLHGDLAKNEFTQPLLDAIRTLVKEYKRVYELEKVKVDLVL
jgi:hypothetical protein